MKRIVIIVEGQTESEFVKNVLVDYFAKEGIVNVSPAIIHTSRMHRGGFVNFEHIRNDVVTQLHSKDKELIVTTLVDYFRCPTNFPGKGDLGYSTDLQMVEHLERCFYEEIQDSRFVPYIQLYEFESLLFASNEGFRKYFFPDQAIQTKQIIDLYPNPEDINTSPEGAPSKRLISIKPDYDKVIEGNLCAMETGISNMMKKCPRFASWIKKLTEG